MLVFIDSNFVGILFYNNISSFIYSSNFVCFYLQTYLYKRRYYMGAVEASALHISWLLIGKQYNWKLFF